MFQNSKKKREAQCTLTVLIFGIGAPYQFQTESYCIIPGQRIDPEKGSIDSWHHRNSYHRIPISGSRKYLCNIYHVIYIKTDFSSNSHAFHNIPVAYKSLIFYDSIILAKYQYGIHYDCIEFFLCKLWLWFFIHFILKFTTTLTSTQC